MLAFQIKFVAMFIEMIQLSLNIKAPPQIEAALQIIQF
jgi:hypothetical protein